MLLLMLPCSRQMELARGANAVLGESEFSRLYQGCYIFVYLQITVVSA